MPFRVLLSGLLILVLGACARTSTLEGSCYSQIAPDPYQGVGYLDNGQELCTATLISARVILTAAHCVQGHRPGDIHFTLSPQPERDPDVQYATGAQIIVHPTFNPNN